MAAIREADEDRSGADGLLVLPNATDTNADVSNSAFIDGEAELSKDYSSTNEAPRRFTVATW